MYKMEYISVIDSHRMVKITRNFREQVLKVTSATLNSYHNIDQDNTCITRIFLKSSNTLAFNRISDNLVYYYAVYYN